jgi:hypothetical protein
MDGISGARAYTAAVKTPPADSSASILRKAVDTAKSDAGKSEAGGLVDTLASGGPKAEADVVDVTADNAAAAAPETSRPIGNIGHHLDLRI